MAVPELQESATEAQRTPQAAHGAAVGRVTAGVLLCAVVPSLSADSCASEGRCCQFPSERVPALLAEADAEAGMQVTCVPPASAAAGTPYQLLFGERTLFEGAMEQAAEPENPAAPVERGGTAPEPRDREAGSPEASAQGRLAASAEAQADAPAEAPAEAQQAASAAPGRGGGTRPLAIVTVCYLAYTTTDGGVRMIVLLHAFQLGFSALEARQPANPPTCRSANPPALSVTFRPL